MGPSSWWWLVVVADSSSAVAVLVHSGQKWWLKDRVSLYEVGQCRVIR